MNKLNDLNSKIFVTSCVIVFLSLLLLGSSVQIETFAVEPGGKPRFDCTYNNEVNKETCCDSSSSALKCIECNVDLQTDVKYNCKEVVPKSNDAQPADLVKAPRTLDNPVQNFSDSDSESES